MKLNMFENIGWQICKHLFKQENYVDLRESETTIIAFLTVIGLPSLLIASVCSF